MGEGQQPASLTSVKVFGEYIFVGDASARIIRRFDATGRQVGLIGDQSKTRAFILPNGNLDIAVDQSGTVWATDSGRHQVTAWTVGRARWAIRYCWNRSGPARVLRMVRTG